MPDYYLKCLKCGTCVWKKRACGFQTGAREHDVRVPAKGLLMADIQITATIKDQVYKIIKMRIIERYYKPGQWLQENDLAAQLNVSRSPVRAALKSLVHDGLVIEIPNKGVFVRDFSRDDIRNIYDMRCMMESYAITSSPKHLQSAICDSLNMMVDQLDKFHRQDDLNGYIKVDARLHETIIGLGGNSLLGSTYQQLDFMLQPFRVYSLLGKERFDESVEEHRGIVYHICRGEVEKAVQISNQHLTKAADAILRYMEEKAL